MRKKIQCYRRRQYFILLFFGEILLYWIGTFTNPFTINVEVHSLKIHYLHFAAVKNDCWLIHFQEDGYFWEVSLTFELNIIFELFKRKNQISMHTDILNIYHVQAKNLSRLAHSMLKTLRLSMRTCLTVADSQEEVTLLKVTLFHPVTQK